MTWFEKYGPDRQPTLAEMETFTDTPLWGALHAYLQETYGVQPKTAYSGCSGQPGWNVKYQKAGKSLCTLYPMEGFYIALVVIGAKEATEYEQLAPTFTPYIQSLYDQADGLANAKWLMAHVTDEAVLADVKQLIGLRRKPQ